MFEVPLPVGLSRPAMRMAVRKATSRNTTAATAATKKSKESMRSLLLQLGDRVGQSLLHPLSNDIDLLDLHPALRGHGSARFSVHRGQPEDAPVRRVNPWLHCVDSGGKKPLAIFAIPALIGVGGVGHFFEPGALFRVAAPAFP